MTYDSWKTTDPRERDLDPESERMSELEDCFEQIRELQDDAKHAASVHAARVKELEAALEQALEYLKDKYDVVDGLDGQPKPNKEMRLGQMIDETLYGIKF